MEPRVISLSAEARGVLLSEVADLARPGDLLLFFHRTSGRSWFVRWASRAQMPHVCVYAGDGEVVGMLKKRVRRHRLARFFRDEYDVELYRGSPEILESMRRWIGRTERRIDLVAMTTMVLTERYTGLPIRRWSSYRMRGVTCCGTAIAAIHEAHGTTPEMDPLLHTPLDLERLLAEKKMPCLLSVRLWPEPASLPAAA